MSDFNQKRRHFLGAGLVVGAQGIGQSPLTHLVKMLTDGIISRAQAAESGSSFTPRSYVNIMLPGAPSRNVFDHWLRTNDDDPNLVMNPMTNNCLAKNASGAATGTTSRFKKVGNLNVPIFFDHNVMNGAGGERPLTDLLTNMLVIRGYGTGVDGHSNNAVTQLGPLGGVSSIAGVAADYSNRTFQALQYPSRGAWGNFTSTTGKAMNIIGGNQPLAQLLAGFKQPVGKTKELMERRQEALRAGTERLSRFSKSGFQGSETVAKNMSAAKELMRKGIDDAEQYWPTALARYTRVFQSSARMRNLPGFSDMTVVPPSNTATQFQVHVSEGDRAIIPRGDLLSIVDGYTTPSGLAEGFALAEYVLKNNLVTSLELMIPTDDPNKIYLADGNYLNHLGSSNNMTNFFYHNDMHANGAVPTVVMTSVLFRGLAASILELSDALKNVGGENLWNRTVVQITSDFGRSGRTDGTGSDHGINQMVSSVFSGVIQEPMVVGNVHAATGDTGSQGQGAQIDGYNQTGMPSPAMMASTVTALLDTPNPFENTAAPLVQVKSGVAKVTIAGKVVA